MMVLPESQTPEWPYKGMSEADAAHIENCLRFTVEDDDMAIDVVLDLAAAGYMIVPRDSRPTREEIATAIQLGHHSSPRSTYMGEIVERCARCGSAADAVLAALGTPRQEGTK